MDFVFKFSFATFYKFCTFFQLTIGFGWKRKLETVLLKTIAVVADYQLPWILFDPYQGLVGLSCISFLFCYWHIIQTHNIKIIIKPPHTFIFFTKDWSIKCQLKLHPIK